MPSGLEVDAAGSRTWWPYTEISQTQGFYAGEEVRLERRGSAEALVLPDPSFLTTLHRVAPELGRRFHHPGWRRRRMALTVGAGVLALVLSIAIYLWGIPAAAGVAASYVPVSWEEYLGAAIMEEMAPMPHRCADARGTLALDTLLSSLGRAGATTAPTTGVTSAAPLSVGPYRIRAVVLNKPPVNAFAVPGGFVVLFRGLVDRVATPEQLAGVLAHEVQHVVRRHSTRALLQHASTALLAAAVLGDASGAMAFGLEGAQALALMRYSRAHETEADVEGHRMLVAAGIDPRGLVEFFQSLERETSLGSSSYLSTHPTPGDRIARLQALPRPSFALAPLTSDEQWQAIKNICSRAQGA
jgi:Zn-dependent protease with chaperone function